MKTGLLAVLLALGAGVSAPAWAQLSCHTDRIGVTTCEDGMGAVYRGKADPKGRLVWRDAAGRTVNGYTDGDGNSILLGPNGAQMVGHEAVGGESAWIAPNGRTVRGYSDPNNGNSVYRDGRGRVVYCHDDGRGHAACVPGREDH